MLLCREYGRCILLWIKEIDSSLSQCGADAPVKSSHLAPCMSLFSQPTRSSSQSEVPNLAGLQENQKKHVIRNDILGFSISMKELYETVV